MFRHIDWCNSGGEYLDDACTCPCKCDTDRDYENCPKHPACCVEQCKTCREYVTNVDEHIKIHEVFVHPNFGIYYSTILSGSYSTSSGTGRYFGFGTQYDES